MTARLLVAIVWLAPLAFAQQAACIAVDGEQIEGRDMAKALPVFAAIRGDLTLAPAPAFNGTREFSVSELETLERRFSIAAPVREPVCFRLAAEEPSRPRSLAAMTAALEDPDAHIEILEMGPLSVPRGNVEFSRDGLGSPALATQRTPVLWRGEVTYGDNRRFPIWARVRVTVPVVKVMAVQELHQGVPIQAEQLRRETSQGFPISGGGLTVEQAAGMLPVRSIAAGTEVRRDNLTLPLDVTRGALVHVEARIGSARVELTGRAESAGRMGDMIPVRNIESSRIFEARVDGKNSVLVDAGALRE